MIGKRASDLFPPDLAALYEEQDASIFDGGLPLRDELELIGHSDGSISLVPDDQIAGPPIKAQEP